MINTYTYTFCYQILNVNPDTNWQELRRSYKKSIQLWHPDQFEDGSDKKKLADEKIKTINTAYTQLQRYYRENGTLPQIETTKPESSKQSTNRAGDINQDYKKPHADKKSSRKRPSPHYKKKSRVNSVLAGTSIFILVSAFYFYPNDSIILPNNTPIRSTNDNYKPAKIETISVPNITNQLKHRKGNLDHQQIKNIIRTNSDYFTIGSSIGDVISIQGTPTNTEGNVWYYGKSEVHFSDGQVTHWIRNNANPIKANLMRAPRNK